MTVDSILAFVAASAILSFAPGPDNLFVLTQSALYGRKSGLWVVLGLNTGLLVHTAAVALGVAAIFQTSAFAFTLLKLLGAGYLLYLAWAAWRASSGKVRLGSQPALPPLALYRRGIIMNVTNPKVSIFFLAFLPQFVVVEQGNVSMQMVLLGSMFIVVSFAVFALIAYLAGTLGRYLTHSDKAQTYLNRTASGVFVLLALKLISSKAN